MKRIYFNLFSTVLLLLVMSSCKKDTVKPGQGTSRLNIVNLITVDSDLLVNFNGTGLSSKTKFYKQLYSLYYRNNQFTASYIGQQKLGLYRPADTVQGGKPLFNLILNLRVNTMNTLFLTGTEQAPDTLFTTNQLPYHVPADSTMGIRFVNVSLGGNPVSVNLAGQANGSAAANLPYKSATGYKNYATRSAIASYTFEFRDGVTGELLATHKLDGINAIGTPDTGGPNRWLNNNITLALYGAPGNKQLLMLMESR
ncbi:hypothetical protein ABIE26_004832 [Pedobacter africanus]|uniref:Uncharacterized protein n=1 Tax=Pedobacter africanus TaxID=151894 RepID=A0ACC6L403_9SPHI|nr:hypothetical protein [Pedobacter africanus]MDR6786113.1 hypothetical protein [Pedobacter africanus]